MPGATGRCPILSSGLSFRSRAEGDDDTLDDHRLDGEDGEGVTPLRTLEDAERITQGGMVAGGFAGGPPWRKERAMVMAERTRRQRPIRRAWPGAADDEEEGARASIRCPGQRTEGRRERVRGGAALATEHPDHGHLGWRVDLDTAEYAKMTAAPATAALNWTKHRAMTRVRGPREAMPRRGRCGRRASRP